MWGVQPPCMQRGPRRFVVTRLFALLALLHDASLERLKRPDIVRIKPGERVDLLCRDLHRSLQHKPRHSLTAGRSGLAIPCTCNRSRREAAGQRD